MQTCRSNIDNYTFNLKAYFDEPLVLEGTYSVQGKVIILPIIGEGRSNLTLGELISIIEAIFYSNPYL